MLRKFTSLFCVVALSVALVGCGEAGTMADKAKETVDTTAETAHGAVDDMVPEAAKDTVEGAVDTAADGAKDMIDKAAGTEEN